MRPFHWVRLPPAKLSNTIWDTDEGGPPVEGGACSSPSKGSSSSFFGGGGGGGSKGAGGSSTTSSGGSTSEGSSSMYVFNSSSSGVGGENTDGELNKNKRRGSSFFGFKLPFGGESKQRRGSEGEALLKSPSSSKYTSAMDDEGQTSPVLNDLVAQPLDLEELENIFGLRPAGGGGGLERQASSAGGVGGGSGKNLLERGRSVSGGLAGGGAAGDAPASTVTLLPVKRANNVEIALSRMRLTNEEIKQAILEPVLDRYSKDNNDSESPKGDGGGAPSPAAAGKWGGATKKLRLRPQLTPENVSALLGVLPTSEESDLVRSHAAELKAKGITSGPIGRVERFFLCLDEIYAPEQRLRSIQVTQQFDERAERLLAHASSLQNACKQLKESVKLRQLLKLVLRIGNFLNGASQRGGAVGFRLADLEKLRQVRSADQSTTLLQYIGRQPPVKSAAWLKDLKEHQLPALFAARGLEVNELRPELSSLRQQFEMADHTKRMLDEHTESAPSKFPSLKRRADPLASLLSEFCETRREKIEHLREMVQKAESEVRGVAGWLAEPANSSVEQLFTPIASFITALEKEQAEQLLAAARQRRAERTQRFLEGVSPNASQPPAASSARDSGATPQGRAPPRRAISSRELESSNSDAAFNDLRAEIQRRAQARRSMAVGMASRDNSLDDDDPSVPPPPPPGGPPPPPPPSQRGRSYSENYSAAAPSASRFSGGDDDDDAPRGEAALFGSGGADGDGGGGGDPFNEFAQSPLGSGMANALRWLVSREEEVETAEEIEAARLAELRKTQPASWSAANGGGLAKRDSSGSGFGDGSSADSPSPSSPIGPAGVTKAATAAVNAAAAPVNAAVNIARQVRAAQASASHTRTHARAHARTHRLTPSPPSLLALSFCKHSSRSRRCARGRR